MTSNLERYRASRTVALVSMATNFSLSIAQVVVGWVGHSNALIADGMHTLSDLLSDVLVLFGARQGAKAADAEHPYGHARIETAVTLALALILIAVGVAIAARAALRLMSTATAPTPSLLTLGVALITLAAKEGLYRYTIAVARRQRSALLSASAWHHRSDAFSSIIVAVGIAGTIAGVPFLDAVAAIGVALMIVRMGGELGYGALAELIDTGASAEQLRRIRAAILQVPGVDALHLLKTRRAAGMVLVDVHILVDGKLSVSEGHHISETVRAGLIREIDEVAEVMVHIDPEDDEKVAPNAGLPLRNVMTQRLRAALAHLPETVAIEHIGLHYLGGKVQVELVLPVTAVGGSREQIAALTERVRVALAPEPAIGAVELRFR